MKRTAIVMSLASLIALGSTVASAEQVEISGKSTLTYSKREALNVADKEGHIYTVGEVKGTGVNTGKSDYMDGAEVTNVEFGDLVNGNGPHQGYYTMVGKNGGSTVAQWKGMVKTVMAEGQPRTSFDGTWRYVHGTGPYAGIKGEGTYRGKFTSPTSYDVDWSGHYSK